MGSAQNRCAPKSIFRAAIDLQRVTLPLHHVARVLVGFTAFVPRFVPKMSRSGEPLSRQVIPTLVLP